MGFSSTEYSNRYGSRRGAGSAAHFYADTSGIAEIGAQLDRLGKGVRKAIRPIAQAGAQVIYERVLSNAVGMGQVTGRLVDSIYQKYLTEQSSEGQRALYRVSWNAKKAPHAHLLEWGWMQTHKVYFSNGRWYTNKDAPLPAPIQRPGYAFVRRAQSALPEAVRAMEAELKKRVQEVTGAT